MLTSINWLLPSLLGDAVAILGCQVPLGSFFVLSFRRRLIVKLLLRRVLINRLPALDAVELGGCSSPVLRSHIGVVPLPFRSDPLAADVIAALVREESCWLRAALIRSAADVVVVLVNPDRYCCWLSSECL